MASPWRGEAWVFAGSGRTARLSGIRGRIKAPWPRRGLLGGLAAVLLLVAGVAETRAQSAECQRLAGALAALDRAGGTRGGEGKWSSAAREQGEAIRQTQAQLSQMGCGVAPTPACAPLRDRLKRMQANLGRLERGVTRTGGSSDVGERQRLLSRLARLNCGATAARPAPQPPRPHGGLLTTLMPQGLFSTARPARPMAPPPSATAPVALSAPAGLIVAPGPGRQPYFYRRDSNGGLVIVGPATGTPAAPVLSAGLNGALQIRERLTGTETVVSDAPPAPRRGGGYRTLCVRKCDGYYFPISYSTTSDRFHQDQMLCSALCPAAETALFTHRTGSEAETMISADEEQRPYTALPMAFRYRTEVVENCGCGGINGGLVPLTLRDGSLSPVGLDDTADGITTPIPTDRPDLDEDPDTLMNRNARHWPIVGDGLAPVASGPTPDGPKRIRIVGPSYYYAR